MAGLFGGSALVSARRALLSWLPFFAAIPLLWLVQHFFARDPDLEYAFQNINHIGIAIILAVSLNLVNGLTGQFSIGHAGFMAIGGAIGLSPIPRYADFTWIWAAAIATILITKRLRESTHGRAFLSVREDEVAAEATGVDTTRYKVRAFVVSAGLAGVAGALSGAFEGNLSPQSFTFVRSFEIVAMVVLGGMGSISGSTLAAGVLTLLPEYLRALAEWRMVIYSLALILLMIVRPRGLFGTQEIWDLLPWRRRRRPVGKVELSEALIDVRHATIRFGGLTAVCDFSLQVKPRELVALIGPNGAGKTTVFNLLTGVYPPSEGTIKVLGRDTRGLSPHAIAHLGCARTFQNIRLFRELTAFDNVRIACHHLTHESMAAAVRQGALSEQEEKWVAERSEEMLEIMGLTHRRDEVAKNLPYGEQRRLEIARALATGPQALLLDEPAAGTNTREKTELMALIRSIRDRFGVAIVLIEHDMKLVMGVSERILVLDHGLTIAQGLPREIQSNAKVIEAYLGEKYAKEHAAQIAAAGSPR